MRTIGYLRVSTHEQRPDRQIIGLKALCDELHIEVLSATSRKRPVYSSIKRRLRTGDVFMVWDIDRAYRSVVDAMSEAEQFIRRGIGFQVAKFSLDVSTPEGIFTCSLISAVAEYERRKLSQRTKEGLAAARLRGVRLGRPPKLDTCQLMQARSRLATGEGTTSIIARELGVSPWTLSRALKRHERINA